MARCWLDFLTVQGAGLEYGHAAALVATPRPPKSPLSIGISSLDVWARLSHWKLTRFSVFGWQFLNIKKLPYKSAYHRSGVNVTSRDLTETAKMLDLNGIQLWECGNLRKLTWLE
jgi:hypothetical protein